MVVHDNLHVPKESWPSWIWLAIEFAIVLAISALTSDQIMSALAESEIHEENKNWVFFGLIGIMFIGWYIIIRGFILKKPILQNR